MSCCWFHHRLTPAHTGNAITNVKRSHLMHGSSPCIQGIRLRWGLISLRTRLIPVYTGNTEIPSPPCHGHAAHPRVYREYGVEFKCHNVSSGSSPCIQGIPGIPVCTVLLCRLIPVYTGNTRAAPARMRKASAHPRVYREYQDSFFVRGHMAGSSPCIQGIHLATRHDTRAKSKKYLVSSRIHI